MVGVEGNQVVILAGCMWNIKPNVTMLIRNDCMFSHKTYTFRLVWNVTWCLVRYSIYAFYLKTNQELRKFLHTNWKMNFLDKNFFGVTRWEKCRIGISSKDFFQFFFPVSGLKYKLTLCYICISAGMSVTAVILVFTGRCVSWTSMTVNRTRVLMVRIA